MFYVCHDSVVHDSLTCRQFDPFAADVTLPCPGGAGFVQSSVTLARSLTQQSFSTWARGTELVLPLAAACIVLVPFQRAMLLRGAALNIRIRWFAGRSPNLNLGYKVREDTARTMAVRALTRGITPVC